LRALAIFHLWKAMPDLALERRLHRQGFRLVAGVDEAGRGPLAGPVVAGAVILDPDLSESEPWLALVDDSKRLSPARREKALAWIQQCALAVGVAQVDAEEIDRLGIGSANVEAMLRAVANLHLPPQYLLLDFVHLKECSLPFTALVKGDSRSYSIAAASIVAKVTRDRLMQEADALYPGYHFARHKGYPTPQHLARLRALGPCPIHRRSFAPVRKSPQPPFTKGGID
jgi:ribonuclease HII